MKLKRFSTAVLAAVMTVSGFGAVSAMAADKTKIFIAGDSTACKYGRDDNYSVPREGWGMALSYMVYDDKAEVVDLAMSGRSSKSFTTEDNYKTLINDMGEGDYVIIQFGHNDAKKTKPEDLQNRYTSDEGDKDTDGSFKNSLYKNYILPTQEKGATPILMTPVSRHDFDDNGKCSDTHGKYDDCIRELAQELNVPCVDMTQLTSDMYDKEGKSQTEAYHALYKTVEKGKYGHDDTHFNRYGALTVAEIARGELLKLDGIKDILRPAKTYTQAYNQYYTVKRADYACVMARILGAEPVEDVNKVFNDTDSTTNPDHVAYLQAAKDMNIVQGDENGNFHPNSPLTFNDMAVMTDRTIKAATTIADQDNDITLKNIKPYAEQGVKNVMALFGDVIVSDINGDELIDMQSAFSMYVNIYDMVKDSSSVEKVQSAEEIEKVE